MRHVKQIQMLVDQGQVAEAHDALDNLLSLGPKNVEALKLRAQLYSAEGRFKDEASIWDHLATIDREDPDVVNYHLRLAMEQQENFYFSEEIQGGGRRFLAYPRMLIKASVFGLFGCLGFLILTKLSQMWSFLADPSVMLATFAILVMVPWLVILVSYARGTRYLSVTPEGLLWVKRFGVKRWAWSELGAIYLAHTQEPKAARPFSLIFVPKTENGAPIEVDLTPSQGVIRARSAMIREVATLWGSPVTIRREELAALSGWSQREKTIII